MATIEQSGGESLSLHPAIKLPHIPWTQILAISIFWLALNFHWAALGIIILPSQVFKSVGDLNKVQALAFVLIPGAFVSLFAMSIAYCLIATVIVRFIRGVKN